MLRIYTPISPVYSQSLTCICAKIIEHNSILGRQIVPLNLVRVSDKLDLGIT